MKKLHGMILLSTMITFDSNASDNIQKKCRTHYEAFTNCVTFEKKKLVSRSSNECLTELDEPVNTINVTDGKPDVQIKKAVKTPRDSDDV